jgi:hypothetical protein
LGQTLGKALGPTWRLGLGQTLSKTLGWTLGKTLGWGRLGLYRRGRLRCWRRIAGQALLTIWQHRAVILEHHRDDVRGIVGERLGEGEGEAMPAIAKAAEAGEVVAQAISQGFAQVNAIHRNGDGQPLAWPIWVSGPAGDDPAGNRVDVAATHERNSIPPVLPAAPAYAPLRLRLLLPHLTSSVKNGTPGVNNRRRSRAPPDSGAAAGCVDMGADSKG